MSFSTRLRSIATVATTAALAATGLVVSPALADEAPLEEYALHGCVADTANPAGLRDIATVPLNLPIHTTYYAPANSLVQLISGPKSDPSQQFRSPVCLTPGSPYRDALLMLPIRADLAAFADAEVTLVLQPRSNHGHQHALPTQRTYTWAELQAPDAAVDFDYPAIRSEQFSYSFKLASIPAGMERLRVEVQNRVGGVWQTFPWMSEPDFEFATSQGQTQDMRLEDVSLLVGEHYETPATHIRFVLRGYVGSTLRWSGISPEYSVTDYRLYNTTHSLKLQLHALKAGSGTITPRPTPGAVLSVELSDWTPATGVTYKYQWYYDGKAVKGATKPTYTVPTSKTASGLKKIYANTVKVKVTGTLNGVSASKTYSSKIAREWVETGWVTIGFDPNTGRFTASPWSSTRGVGWKYQWLRDGVAISKQTGASYQSTPADAGKRISVRATPAVKSPDRAISRTSISQNPGITFEGALVVRSGDAAVTAPRVGQTLWADSSTVRPVRESTDGGQGGQQVFHGSLGYTPVVTYQWYRGGKAISGATSDTYVVSAADLGKTVDVRIRYTNPSDKLTPYSTTLRHAALKKVAKGVLPKPAVTVTQVGRKLTASADNRADVAGTTVKYQWYRSGKKISGATKSAYTLNQSKDAGKSIKVKVSYSKKAYTSTSTTVSKNYTVQFSAAPKIIGTAKVGQQLSVSYSLANASQAVVSYQWYRDGKAIKGASKDCYTLTKSDKGKRITVKVTVKDAQLLTASKTSAKSAKVQ